MKYLIMCEGTVEKAFIDLIIEKGLFKIKTEDIINESAFHSRQIDGDVLFYINALSPRERLTILRIGDTLNDKLRIPRDLRKIKHIEIRKYCTKPEMEYLVIINEDLVNEFNKVKSEVRPKSFVRGRIKLGRQRWRSNPETIIKYFSGVDIKGLLKKYKRMKKGSHPPDELFLYDLLN